MKHKAFQNGREEARDALEWFVEDGKVVTGSLLAIPLDTRQT
jgi:hypothetical protein